MDKVSSSGGPAASAEPFLRYDDAAGNVYELVKLAVLSVTLAPQMLEARRMGRAASWREAQQHKAMADHERPCKGLPK